MEQEMENNTPIESAIQEQPTDSQKIESKSENVQEDNIEDNKMKNKNPMQEIEIEKMVLHCGGTEDKLEKSIKLLEMISGSKKIYVVRSTRRIPTFGISPGKKSGAKITIRDKVKIKELLERFFVSMDNELPKKQITTNQVCFGIPEYIEIPGLEYNRDIGITGFEVMLVFKRKGKSVKLRKIKKGKYPKRQDVAKEEIENYMESKFNLEIE
ncbi:MAG TPA: 50S ribosomal protein L5 [Candidatus Pacearchaeota archaeon]|jgi:large subunit ribosomal protein L5|nr:50S ribosomal protein L5 [Candidatus Pacearchaeota archaeon]HJO14628.1 50S ribosomal protein L5 [Candidatus Pacearchaeota archaeon]|tara:strand:+ start:1447 stop:2082 length:636 start_codon:yes stop_codon:yes gene_type:complete